jgi:hypothetical protein
MTDELAHVHRLDLPLADLGLVKATLGPLASLVGTIGQSNSNFERCRW